MDRKLLSSRLRQMAVNTGTLNCLGCGCEHNCSTRGCAVLKQAAEIVESVPGWANAQEKKPSPGERVLVTDCVFVGEGYLAKSGKFYRYYEIPMDFILAGEVTHWMPLPEPPEEGTK